MTFTKKAELRYFGVISPYTDIKTVSIWEHSERNACIFKHHSAISNIQQTFPGTFADLLLIAVFPDPDEAFFFRNAVFKSIGRRRQSPSMGDSFGWFRGKDNACLHSQTRIVCAIDVLGH